MYRETTQLYEFSPTYVNTSQTVDFIWNIQLSPIHGWYVLQAMINGQEVFFSTQYSKYSEQTVINIENVQHHRDRSRNFFSH